MKRGFWWLMFFMFILFGGRTGEADLRGDSMLYAAISNNVLFSDNPMRLMLNGEVYMNKPPLMHWVNAFFIKLFGAAPVSVMLSTLIAVLFITYFLYKIALELFDDENTALILPVLFFSTYIVYKNTQSLKLEAFVSAFVIAAVFFFLRYIREGKTRYAVFFGIASGLAVFAKGPLGLVVYAPVFIFPVFSSAHRTWGYYRHTLYALIITLAIPSWWFAFALSQDQFFEKYFLSQMLDRVGNNSISVTGTVYTERPVWKYLYYILKYGGLFIILFPLGLYRLIKERRFSPGIKFMLLLGTVYFIIIHMITTREQRYLYQFYLFFWFAGAYGLTSYVRKGYVGLLRTASFVLIIFLLFYPHKLGWNSYDALVKAREVSVNGGLPIVAREGMLPSHYDQAALSFYVRDHLKSPPETGSWLEVTEDSDTLENAEELFRSRKVKVYLVYRDGE